jgi:hypothetical protein
MSNLGEQLVNAREFLDVVVSSGDQAPVTDQVPAGNVGL